MIRVQLNQASPQRIESAAVPLPPLPVLQGERVGVRGIPRAVRAPPPASTNPISKKCTALNRCPIAPTARGRANLRPATWGRAAAAKSFSQPTRANPAPNSTLRRAQAAAQGTQGWVEEKVRNLFIVPKHFFVREIIEERKPLAATARRAGWTGSKILLSRVPESGKIHIVQNGLVRTKELVLAEWQKTLFLRNESPETRGWLLDVMKCVESLGKRDFTLDEVYAFQRHLGDLYPGNQNVKPKIRQQLQFLRDRGFIDFVSRGNYRLRS
jgi:hypothetical protein